MDRTQQVIEAIRQQGLLPLFYHEDVGVSLKVLEALYKGGVRVLEFTNRGSKAFENFKALKEASTANYPDLLLGIGTIKNATEADQFIGAGADFIVCPVVDEAIGERARSAGLLWIPGCLTPTEINVAFQAKAGIIKLFPANMLGPGYLSAVNDIFPGQLFIPTGGVDLTEQNIRSWFDAGVVAVGMGSKLITNKILEEQDFEKLAKDTRHVIDLIAKWR